MENVDKAASQHKAAKLAGYMYLFGMAASILVEFYLRGSLVVRGNAEATAQNIIANDTQFRIAIALDLLTYISVLLLAWAFYIVLKPVNKNLALLAVLIRVVEVSLFCVILTSNFNVLQLLGSDANLNTFETDQLHTLSRVALRTKGDSYTVGFILLGLASAIFSYLLYKSNYIPRLLAGFGIFASTLFFIGNFAVLIFPEISKIAMPSWYASMFVFEIGLGLWLVIKGVRLPLKK